MVKVLLEDLKNYLMKDFEAQESDNKIFVREVGSPVAYIWNQQDKIAFRHLEGDDPVEISCDNINQFFKFICKCELTK